jgi:hypothetical protein
MRQSIPTVLTLAVVEEFFSISKSRPRRADAQSRLVSILLDDNPHDGSTIVLGTIRACEKIFEACKLLK